VEGFRSQILRFAKSAIEPEFVPAFSKEEAPEFLPPRIGQA
jgi:choline-sulfatase